ncbi:MAG TPA: energy-coupling factor transporter transmembrane protein EcfT [Mycobacteriales bacterium]|nr:energy-coupling factor transporter transmembrane protein EcfT [Mycobacteriales bacterium]
MKVREVHPAAWWLWSLGLALLASRTTNMLLVALILAMTTFVALSCRRPSPWSSAYLVFVKIGIAAVVLRVTLTALAGAPIGTHVLVTLPQAHLPHVFAGTRIGGPITAEELALSAEEGVRLLAMLACVGVANVVTTPSRLVKSMPAALYEAGLAVTVAVSIAPQTVAQLRRVRAARRLRGRPTRGLAGVRGLGVPVLEGALASSLALAAAMDSRGYGRRVPVRRGRRVIASTAALGGIVVVGAGTYGITGGGPRWFGWPLLSAGAVLLVTGLLLGGARSPRTRYRADRWDVRASALAALGVLAVIATTASDGDPLLTPGDPLAVPNLPWLPAAAVLVAALAAFLDPAPRRAKPTADPPVGSAPLRAAA